MSAALISKKDIEAINNYHSQIEGTGEELLGLALNAGERLAKVKASLPHGSFMQWVADNLEFSHKTATNYLRLYEAEQADKLESVSTLAQAYRLLTAPPKVKASPTPPPAPAPSEPVEADIVSDSRPPSRGITVDAEIVEKEGHEEDEPTAPEAQVDEDTPPLVIDGTQDNRERNYPKQRIDYGSPCSGMEFWGMARSQLQRINKIDRERVQALEACIKYCQQRINDGK